MATADGHDGGWLTLAQAATPRSAFDARRNAFIPPRGAEIEKRQRELVDDLRAGRRWRDYNKEGWQTGRIPTSWWTHNDINWTLGLLMHGGRVLWVQISDADEIEPVETVVSEPPPAAAAALPPAAAADDAVIYSTGAPGRRTSSHIVRPEAAKRLAGGRPCRFRLDLATDLSQWLTDKHPFAAPMKPKTISTAIADLWLEAIK
jgi:hypothetical protein